MALVYLFNIQSKPLPIALIIIRRIIENSVRFLFAVVPYCRTIRCEIIYETSVSSCGFFSLQNNRYKFRYEKLFIVMAICLDLSTHEYMNKRQQLTVFCVCRWVYDAHCGISATNLPNSVLRPFPTKWKMLTLTLRISIQIEMGIHQISTLTNRARWSRAESGRCFFFFRLRPSPNSTKRQINLSHLVQRVWQTGSIPN